MLALVRPALMTRSATTSTGERFYASAYAGRAIPFGVAAAVLPLVDRGPAVAVVLLVAAAAQFADAGIGVWRKEPGMVAGAGSLTAIHVITALAVL